MLVTWHSFDLKSGRRGPEVTVQEDPEVSRIIGEPTDASLAVLCWDEQAQAAVPGWDAATLPGRVMVVALDEFETPVWGGMVVRRRSDAGPWVTLDLATLEAYFDRRYVKDHTYTATAQGAIVSGILNGDVIPSGVQFVIDADSATLRDRTYLDDDDKTALSVLQELMGVDGGPEFTVDLEWHDDTHTTLDRIVKVRSRIGQTSNAVFEMPGSVTSFEYVEDFTSDNAANDVMASSSGEGDARPESSHHVAQDLIDAGWVKFEERFTPSTSIIDIETLNGHAEAELQAKKLGLVQLSLEAHLDTAPRFGSDWHLGDDVLVSLTCARFPAQTGPDGDVVAGFTATRRAVGVTLNFKDNRVTPRFVGEA